MSTSLLLTEIAWGSGWGSGTRWTLLREGWKRNCLEKLCEKHFWDIIGGNLKKQQWYLVLCASGLQASIILRSSVGHTSGQVQPIKLHFLYFLFSIICPSVSFFISFSFSFFKNELSFSLNYRCLFFCIFSFLGFSGFFWFILGIIFILLSFVFYIFLVVVIK